MATQLELSAKLAEIGAQLKQRREDKELTLEEVQASTLIPKNHLQAIEEGNLDRLPELVYVQGFIRKYGQAIGMVEIATELTNVPTPTRSRGSEQSRPELRPWHLYALYVSLVVASVTILSFLFRTPLSPPVPSPPSEEQPQPTATELSPPTAPLPVNVAVEMIGESWMRVVVDGTLEFEGIMPEGTVTQWSGNKEIILRTGNAAAVKVQFNQKPPQLLGAEGEVVELVFDRDSVNPLP